MSVTISYLNLKKRAEIHTIPGDKSISHRAIIVGALATNTSHFTNFLCAEDCLNTAHIFQALGVPIEINVPQKTVSIKGVGLHGLTQSAKILDVGNAGTGIRLIAGVLAGQSFSSTLTGDASIQKRPMKRIIDPLIQMGANITGIEKNGSSVPPLTITPSQGPLQGIAYTLPMASAQVKSCILFAGLYAEGQTRVTEPKPSRNHTEEILSAYGAKLQKEGHTLILEGRPTLKNPNTAPIPIPSDFSSAAFFIVLALLLQDTTWTLTNISLNPTRIALLDVLKDMGANIKVIPDLSAQFEPIGTLIVSSSTLKNRDIPESVIPILIDEIPILAIAGFFAEGTLRIRNAEELRVKESDRITMIHKMIVAMGGHFSETEDGFDLEGGQTLPKHFEVETAGDHRIAMSAIIATMAGKSEVTLSDDACIQTSFPNFMEILTSLNALS